MIWQALEKQASTIRLLLALLIGVSICSAAAACRERIAGVALELNPWALSLALLLCVGYRVLNAGGWTFVLRALRQPLPARTCVRIWLTAEACRWLPGSIWNYGSRAVQAKRAGLTTGVAAASVALELALTMAAWFLVAVLFVLVHNDWASRLQVAAPRGLMSVVVPSCLVALLMVGLVWRWAGRWIADRLRHVASQLKTVLDLRPHGRWSAVALVYYVGMVLFQGVVLVCVSRALPFADTIPSSVLVGANAVAWLIGFFAFMAPGGLVVREGGLAAILVAWLPWEQAFALAIVWRLLQMAAELLCLGAVYSLRVCHALRSSTAAGETASNVKAPTVDVVWACVSQSTH